jgi:hypothetical protein
LVLDVEDDVFSLASWGLDQRVLNDEVGPPISNVIEPPQRFWNVRRFIARRSWGSGSAVPRVRQALNRFRANTGEDVEQHRDEA